MLVWVLCVLIRDSARCEQDNIGATIDTSSSNNQQVAYQSWMRYVEWKSVTFWWDISVLREETSLYCVKRRLCIASRDVSVLRQGTSLYCAKGSLCIAPRDVSVLRQETSLYCVKIHLCIASREVSVLRQGTSLYCVSYLHLPEGFFAEVGWSKSAVRRRSVDRTEVANTVWWRLKGGWYRLVDRDLQFGHLYLASWYRNKRNPFL
jgi:hypothetical protein